MAATSERGDRGEERQWGDRRQRRDRGGLGDGGERSERGNDPEAVARHVVLERLTRAPQTRAQLSDRLRRRGVPDAAADAVLDRFTEVGLIDDAAYAEAWVQTRHAGRGLARRALAHELRQRGVSGVDVDAALEELSSEAEEERARALVRSRLPSSARLDRAARVRRLAGLLARKGYPPGLAQRVVREELEAARIADAAASDAADPDDT